MADGAQRAAEVADERERSPPLEHKQDHEERRPEQNLTDAVRAESLKRKA
mgnify:CR=1 FL=1